jgi:ATP-dependent helicase HrpA
VKPSVLHEPPQLKITYPVELPVTQYHTQLFAAIATHPVLIVSGETGSGKTTQLPKICLELGRGAQGLIGQTQPRRLAARSVAQRLAEELQVVLGGLVGYQIRFNQQISEQTLVKVMTDGVLLAEIQRDHGLKAYSTLIIDEAHERSLSIDFILGYLKQLLPKRPDLKVIITSATLDPQHFSHYFDHAPLIEISGRSYPIEVRYRPVDMEGEATQDPAGQALIEAVEELRHEPPGDMLIFLSGEREIREAAELLAEQAWPDTEIVPLYARLSIAEQQRAFQAHALRRVVLATNVAETSLTIPGIRYVIDSGKARISRYSHRSKVQQLPIEAISQASANQRQGRCGRLAPGICIRLYSEEDFLNRPLYTEPAILRTNLAAVILQMLASGLTTIESFPFIDPPDRRYLQDGLRLLQELGAVIPGSAEQQQLTPLGRQLAQLPLDPRLARMLLAAQSQGCVQELLIITTALSIQDPRERPLEKQQAADQYHQRFADKQSDFLFWVNLWHYLQEAQRQLSSSAFRKQCRAEYLNVLRVREWQDLYQQLRQVVKRLPLTINQQPADYRSIHCALLSGLLSQIGQKMLEKPGFRGARQLQFFLFPNSVLFKKPPAWVVVAELMNTSRLWGRTAARIEPEWVEPLAGHLLHHRYSEPRWDQRRGSVVAQETVTLYGLPIVAARKVDYGRLDPPVARDLFIRHALVAGEWQCRHPFWQHNLSSLAAAEVLEHKARRRDFLVDHDTLFAFYDHHLPAEVVSAAHFDRWWRVASQTQPQLLMLTQEQLLNKSAATLRLEDYPEVWEQGSLTLVLRYQFTPGEANDGVTMLIPLPLLPSLSPDSVTWQVPGLRSALITALIKSLPKSLRRHFVPVPHYVEAFLQREILLDRPLVDVLSEALYRMTGLLVSQESWGWSQIPDHLKMRFEVLDDTGSPIAQGRDLGQLQQHLNAQATQQLATLPANPLQAWIGEDLQAWTFGNLPQVIEQPHGESLIQRFPTLVESPFGVTLQLVATLTEQQACMLAGSVRLLLRTLPATIKTLQKQLDHQTLFSLAHYPSQKPLVALEDCHLAVIEHHFLRLGGVVWEQAAFQERCKQIRTLLMATALPVLKQMAPLLTLFQTLHQQLHRPYRAEFAEAIADMQQQLSQLIYPRFVRNTGINRLPDLLRYLKAVQQRLEKLPRQLPQDKEYRLKIAALLQAYEQCCMSTLSSQPIPAELSAIRWMIEELRVSYFAQALGTPYPISEKRIRQALQR